MNNIWPNKCQWFDNSSGVYESCDNESVTKFDVEVPLETIKGIVRDDYVMYFKDKHNRPLIHGTRIKKFMAIEDMSLGCYMVMQIKLCEYHLMMLAAKGQEFTDYNMGNKLDKPK